MSMARCYVGQIMPTPSKKTPTPLPRIARFEKLGFGLFLHWGLYSQMGQGEWILCRSKMKVSDYNKLAGTFTAADFDARAIARRARAAGMKYIVLTTRHHEGFSLYDTRGLSKFDAMHTPAGRDLVAEFVEGCKAEKIVPFLYHTTLDWQWEPQWWGVHGDWTGKKSWGDYLDYLHASVEVLCRHYGPIGGLWFDGNWAHPKADWKEDRLYKMIRRHQPDAMIINNTGIGAEGRTGHPEIDSVTFEQALPRPIDRRGWPKYVAGEMCQTMNSHWGIGANDVNYLSPPQVIQNLSLCRRVGANYLLNVGPTATGALPEYESGVLAAVGRWMAVFGKCIYEPKPEVARCSGRDFLLRAGDKFYYFAFDLGVLPGGHHPAGIAQGHTTFRAVGDFAHKIKRVRWLDTGEELKFMQNQKDQMLGLHLTESGYGTQWVVKVAELS